MKGIVVVRKRRGEFGTFEDHLNELMIEEACYKKKKNDAAERKKQMANAKPNPATVMHREQSVAGTTA